MDPVGLVWLLVTLFGGLLKPINPNSLDRIYPQKSGLKLMGYNVCSGNHYTFL